MQLTAGQSLQNGKYILNAALYQGELGLTCRATHTYLKQSVILKTLSPTLASHADFGRCQKRFAETVRHLAQCNHPSLVRILDYFQEEGLPFLVMEEVAGRSLADLVKAGGPLPEAQAVFYLRQIGLALHQAHQHQIIHGDVRPQHMLRRQGGEQVVLIGFGLIRECTATLTGLPPNWLVPGYAAPEQYQTPTRTTAATDVYGLAATLYYLLTGQTPVPAPQRDRVPLPRLSQVRPGLSLLVEQAVIRGMEMEPHLRPQSVAEWLNFLPPPSNGNGNGNGNGARNGSTQNGSTKPPAPEPALPVLAELSNPLSVPTAPPVSVDSGLGSVPQQIPQVAAPSRLPKVLFLSAAIATSVGLGLGLALRFSAATLPGSTFLRIEQTFPEREWAGTAAPNGESTPQPSAPVEPVAPTRNSIAPLPPRKAPVQLATPRPSPVDIPIAAPSPLAPAAEPAIPEPSPLPPDLPAPAATPSTLPSPTLSAPSPVAPLPPSPSTKELEPPQPSPIPGS